MDPPMMVVVFRSRLREEARSAFAEREAEVWSWAQKMPGLVSSKDFVAEDGERVAIIEFRSAEELQAWREHAGHKLAQQQGRDEFFESYSLQVCELVRESRFSRTP
jgi:heme-degrading monooxygenase HmoA